MPPLGYYLSADRASRDSSAANGAEKAAWAASRGWAVVRIIPGTKKAAEKWRELSWRDPETVRRIWDNEAVGILTGPSRLVCDDLDVDDEGNPAGPWELENLADGDWDKLPATFALDTPSGGKQLIWKAPRDREFKTCAGQIAPHIDVRGRGGLFVLWDPTQPGRFVTDDREPVEMPSWLAELHPEPGSAIGKIADIPNVRAWLDEYGDGEPCKLMTRTRDKWLDRLEDSGVPHETMKDAVYALVGDCVAGHTGLNSALSELRDEFFKVVRGRKRERERVADWRNSVRGAIARKVGELGEPVDDDQCVVLEALADSGPIRSGKNGRNLPGEFWDYMPELEHIRQAAYSRGRSADSVLGVVLTRMSAFAPVDLALDAGLGPTPITLFCALCGPPESGKSVSIQVGIALLPKEQFWQDGTFAGDLPWVWRGHS